MARGGGVKFVKGLTANASHAGSIDFVVQNLIFLATNVDRAAVVSMAAFTRMGSKQKWAAVLVRPHSPLCWLRPPAFAEA